MYFPPGSGRGKASPGPTVRLDDWVSSSHEEPNPWLPRSSPSPRPSSQISKNICIFDPSGIRIRGGVSPLSPLPSPISLLLPSPTLFPPCPPFSSISLSLLPSPSLPSPPMEPVTPTLALAPGLASSDSVPLQRKSLASALSPPITKWNSMPSLKAS